MAINNPPSRRKNRRPLGQSLLHPPLQRSQLAQGLPILLDSALNYPASQMGSRSPPLALPNDMGDLGEGEPETLRLADEA